ncbi:MAG: hypothetical protein IPF96_21345 [Rhodobacter sp.]|nr:hypothetical protein [Rhodobacter sp.]
MVSALASPFGRGIAMRRGPKTKTYVAEAAFEGNLLDRPRDVGPVPARPGAPAEISLGEWPSLGWLRAALTECGALAVLAAPRVPAISALGMGEKGGGPGASASADGGLQGAGRKLDLYPGAEHEIMMEGPAARRLVFFDRACALSKQIAARSDAGQGENNCAAAATWLWSLHGRFARIRRCHDEGRLCCVHKVREVLAEGLITERISGLAG